MGSNPSAGFKEIMKTIFLDIDGVLNKPSDRALRKVYPHRYMTRPSRPGDFLNLQMVYILRRLCEIHDCEIVIVSSWASSKEDVLEISEMLGFSTDVVGKTDYTGGGINRGESVKRYVRENGITDYVILDDSWQEMYGDHSHVVEIDGKVGLTSINRAKAGFILDGFLNS